jgi:hypothetical protein
MDQDDFDTNEDEIVKQFDNYYQFLGEFIKDNDRKYLEDEDLARDVKELYDLNNGDIRCKADFDRKKKELEMLGKVDENKEKPLYSQNFKFQPKTFLYELQSREQEVRNGRKSTIIFIRYKDQLGKEHSAYIDYRERLKNDNFEEIFNGTKDLIPKPSDLSYYSWNQKKVCSNDSTFFRVDAGPKELLSFRNNTDRKIINVDLEYLGKNPNLDVDRCPVELMKIESNIETILINISAKKKSSKSKNNVVIHKKIKEINLKTLNGGGKEMDEKDWGYQQIVIFDYQTRNK